MADSIHVVEHRAGPLSGLRILEFAGKGPAPFAAMVLSDLGAEVIQIDRVPPPSHHRDYRPEFDVLRRGRPAVGVDLKLPAGRRLALDLLSVADALVEGYRPGVMEALGLGPDVCLRQNPRLVYARATGWGQAGVLAASAGHDINYLAVSGVLNMLGRAGQPPTPPANLLGDFGGGGMLVAVGVLAAVICAARTGRGQVVDAAMLDGASLLATMLHGLRAAGQWSDERGTNLLDTGAPYYDVYATADGRWIAVGALEARFFQALVRTLGLDGDEAVADPTDRASWPAMRARFAAVFATRTLKEWVATFDGADACVSPVLTLDEAEAHEHNRLRGLYLQRAGIRQPAPAPRFSGTPVGGIGDPDTVLDGNPLRSWGVRDARLAQLVADGVVVPSA